MIHLMDQRPDFLDGEVAHALLEHLLLFAEEGEWRAGSHFEALGGHWGRLRRRIIVDVSRLSLCAELRPRGEIGIRRSLKISSSEKGRAGSSPAGGTTG